MRRKRRSRKNAWFGKPRLHRKAARRGWSKRRSSRRRTRRNAGSTSLVRNTTRSLKAGFAPTTLKKAGTILAGNMGASFFTDKLAMHFPIVRSNPVIEIATLLLLASGQGMFVKRFIPKVLNANDIFIGGLIAGATRALKMVLPKTFQTCGLGEDLDGLGYEMDGMGDYSYVQGMGDYTVSPGNPVINTQGGWVNRLNGMDAYPGPQAPTIGTHGLDDSAVIPQVQRAITLDGMADMAVADEISNQM